ncbi:unnamed protein product [marine sediment metagenome]|uniref:Uncharacterized protein n=1 Tax=marine sediment metagenome TaxID=412755 RepID=X0TKA6_9ZZZZ
MRMCVRLGGLAVLLVGIAMALVYLRTDTVCAGHRLHSLFREKRDLEKSCKQLELTVAGYKSPERLWREIQEWRAASEGAGAGPLLPFLAERGNGAPP